MIKADVIVYGVRPEMAFIKPHVADILARHGVQYIPTSVVGKKHKKGSLHPVGFAEDIRTKHIMGDADVRKSMLDQIVAELQVAIPQCDFILEHFGMAREHIHWEFDPKNDPVFQDHKAIYKATGEWPT